MSVQDVCSLCCTTSSEYKSLQTDLDECNEIYNITVKYFDSVLFTQDKSTSSDHHPVLCRNCWFHINEFHEFQQQVLKTRMLWEDESHLKTLLIDVNSEEAVRTNMPTSKSPSHGSLDKSEDDDEDNLFKYNLEYDHREPTPKHTDGKGEENSLALEENMYKGEHNFTTKRKLGINTKSTIKKTTKHEKTKQAKLIEDTKAKACTSFNMERARESDAFIAEWKPELICDLCSESATDFDKLRNHFKTKHKTRFYIKCCERKFYHRCVLVNHIQLHLNPETHKCDICGKSSTTKENLKLHKKTMHEDTKQLKCNICEKLFKRKVTLERHLLTHSTSSKDFICSECGKGYINEQLLKYHIKYVHNVDCVCEQCGKTIHGSQALKNHLMDHAGIERPKFPCDVCGIELLSAYGLKCHKGIYHNDGSTIYVCGVCGKVAANEISLLSHKRLVHATERKHKCTYCDKAFKQPKLLREHIATHTGEDLYQCPHCPQKFKVNTKMHQHRKRKHPVEWAEARKNRRQCPRTNNNQVKKHIAIY